MPNAVDDSRKEVSPTCAEHGDTLAYTITTIGSGQPMTITDAIPVGTSYVIGSDDVNPDVGSLSANSSQVTWTGTVTEATPFQITFQVRVAVTLPLAIQNTARLQLEGNPNTYDLQATAIANAHKVYLPVILKHPSF